MKPSPLQIALVAAAVVGVGLGGYGIGRLVGGDEKTVTVKSLVTATPTTATVERTTTKTRTKTVTTDGGDGGSEGYDSPTAAARPYLEDELGFGPYVDETVTYSDEDSGYALVTYFDNDANPAAVWVKKTGGGWEAVAGTTTPGEPAPSGLGIPDDISLPFSD